MMLQLLERWIMPWAVSLGRYKDLPRRGETYMTRLHGLSTNVLGAFLHRFWKSDPEGLHCHPWRWWISIVLTGGYWEILYGEAPRWRGPGSIVFRQGRVFHRVILPEGGKPTWTLFLRGRRVRFWGTLPESTRFQWVLGPEQLNHPGVETYHPMFPPQEVDYDRELEENRRALARGFGKEA